jgi:hypothetical protein
LINLFKKEKKKKTREVVGRKDIKVTRFTGGIDEFIRGGREIERERERF